MFSPLTRLSAVSASQIARRTLFTSTSSSAPSSSTAPAQATGKNADSPPVTSKSNPAAPVLNTETPIGAPLVRESSSSPEEMNSRPLPYLSFALGVPYAPSSAAQTWAERKAQLLSDDHRMASRRAIVKEATRGYFHDFHAIRSHGGKTWRAPPSLIKEERALWFPRIEGTRLLDKSTVNTVDMFRDKVSIVSLLNSKISEEHTKSFYENAMATFAGNPKLQLVQINLQSNPLKSFMVSLFLSSLKSQIDTSLHATYMLSNQNMELEQDAIGLHNKHVGYTYLVDTKGRIRWAGGAFAEPAEAKALTTCTGVLLDRKKL